MGSREARPDDWLREPRRTSGPKPSSLDDRFAALRMAGMVPSAPLHQHIKILP